MCEPTTLAALQIAATIAAIRGQQQAVEYQNQTNQRQYEATMQARAANINQTNLMQQQEREGAMQKLEENNLKANAALSTAKVASGEAGVSGLSVNSLLADLGTKQNRFNSSIETNYDRTTEAINIQRQNVGINAQSQTAQLKAPAMPDYFGAALRIGNALNGISNSSSPTWRGTSNESFFYGTRGSGD